MKDVSRGGCWEVKCVKTVRVIVEELSEAVV